MKSFEKIIVLALLSLLLLLPATALAKDLDEIQNYGVSVQLREDGTMDLTYHVDWKVLDDQAEGPLEWVQIGIPNSHADSFTAISANIRSVGLSSASGGAYAKVTFDRKYRAGETVSFDFSFHQSYMYVIEGNTVRYSLTPGWFDKIEVKNAVIRWNASGVTSSNATVTEEDYLYWKTALRKGERLRAEVTYPKSFFMELDTAKQATKTSSGNDGYDVLTVLVGMGLLVALFVWVANKFNDGYGGGSGFGGRHHHTVIIGRSGGCVRSSCACASCACACACACAGGGRAGCSKKDFYRGPGENAQNHSDDVFPLLFEALKNTK